MGNIEGLLLSASEGRILHEFAAAESSIGRLPVEPTAGAISISEWTAAISLEGQLAEQITERVAQMVRKPVDHDLLHERENTRNIAGMVARMLTYVPSP